VRARAPITLDPAAAVLHYGQEMLGTHVARRKKKQSFFVTPISGAAAKNFGFFVFFLL
jgi:hypothetical protein